MPFPAAGTFRIAISDDGAWAHSRTLFAGVPAARLDTDAIRPVL